MVELPLSPMANALQFARSHLRSADNLGRTGASGDLYTIIDVLAEGVRASNPASRCAEGCSDCCRLNKALIRIFQSEWDTLHDYLLSAWSPAKLTAFVGRFWSETGPYLPVLEAYQARLDRGDRVRPDEAELPIDCPFLVSRSCSVYPARAAICRGFGSFILRPKQGDELEIYACHLQRAALGGQDPGGPHPTLPVFNTIYEQLEVVCDNEPKKLIPLWIARTFPRTKATRGEYLDRVPNV